MYNRSTVIDRTVYRRYTQFVVSTTYYHILPFVAKATQLSFFDILLVVLYNVRARARFLYTIALYIAHIAAICSIFIHVLFIHVLATFVHGTTLVPVVYYGHNQTRGTSRTARA